MPGKQALAAAGVLTEIVDSLHEQIHQDWHDKQVYLLEAYTPVHVSELSQVAA